MGTSSSTPKKVDKSIKKQLNSEAKQARRSISALLLGAGGSGKSTVLKQFSKIHNGFIDDEEMAKAVITTRKNIIYDMIDICSTYLEERDKNNNPIILNCEENKFELFHKFIANQYGSSPSSTSTTSTDRDNNKGSSPTTTELSSTQKKSPTTDDDSKDSDQRPIELFDRDEMEPFINRFAGLQDILAEHTVIELTGSNAKKISKLWRYPGIQYAYELRKLSHVMDNTPWLLDRVETIADPNYEGSFDAYLRVRDRTTGVIQCKFEIDVNGNKPWIFEITDVGGQRAERRKWVRVFRDNITLVLYVMSLSAYDQVLFEDNTTKCYDETFKIFQEISQNPIFHNTDFAVFFNKVDIFDVKIEAIPFTVYDPTFCAEWAHDRKKVVGYVREKFETIFKENTQIMNKEKENDTEVDRPHRNIFFHVTCATDTRHMQQVIQEVQFGIVQRQLDEAQLT